MEMLRAEITQLKEETRSFSGVWGWAEGEAELGEKGWQCWATKLAYSNGKIGYKKEVHIEIVEYEESRKTIQEPAVLNGPKDGKVTAIMAMKKNDVAAVKIKSLE